MDWNNKEEVLKKMAMLKKNIVTKFEKTRNATNSGYIMQF